MIVILLIYVVLGIALFFLPELIRKSSAILIAFVQFGAFIYFISKIPLVLEGGKYAYTFEWIAEIGLQLQFTLDGLNLIFALLITGIGTLVFLYSHAYMKSYKGTGRFNFYLIIFSAAMLGLVFSTNLIQLFIFWELTSIISFLLISFFNEKEEARKAAFQSLFVTGFGGLLLLAGIILIGSIAGSYNLSDWISASADIKEHKLYLPGLLLILAGVFTKSAQFPFHFWLPGAMQAPTPVSAYLHSATMVKVGVFLLFRLSPVLGGTAEWTHIIPFIGVVTMLVGSYFAATQTDLKAILAYTTISALGILVLLLGIDTKLSVKAALLFLFVHAFYKAALFMIAGIIDKKTGTRDIQKLGKLAKYMPLTFVVALLAAFSMAGLPPMLGFIGKELIYEAKVQSPGIASLVLILGVSSNIIMVFVSLFFTYKTFFGNSHADSKQIPNEKGFLLMTGPVVLALLSIFFGLFPDILSVVIEPGLAQIRAENVIVKLKLWHGFNQVFLLSLITVLLGTILFFIGLKFKGFLPGWKKINGKVFLFDLSKVFANAIQYFINFSQKKTSRVQHGYHRYYVLSIIVFVTILLWLQMLLTGGWSTGIKPGIQPFYISGLVLVIILATMFSLFLNSRIATIIAMGVVGYGISLIYLYYSAVDLAITQILIETLTVILFVLILQKLPLFAKLSTKKTKIRDFIIALSFGSVMTLVALKAISVDFHQPISDYFIKNSYLKAYGENVVNVILVDFRAFDTLGEVVVLVIAAVGVFALLKNKITKI
jgi:multicomponent Na+:H+ antiporter subunit A